VPVREPLAASTSYPDATAVVSFTAQATGATITAVAGVGLVLVAFDLVALAAVAVVVLRRRRIRSD
jgi:hypothetical protein